MQFFNSSQPFNSVLKPGSIVLCDENTQIHCLPLLQGDFKVIRIPAGEESKTLQSCELVWNALVNLNADRDSHLFCLGGGMICDLGAFVASTFMRGISYSLIPTSLLAMVDAAIGGKCGVDFGNLKNYIGLFSAPHEVYVNPEFLETLPDQEWNNGVMEMIKHGLISDRSHFERVMQLTADRKLLTLEDIKASIAIKESHVQHDFHEKGIRKRLNYGHTVAHALESKALGLGRPIGHGLAVAVGMLAEAYLSFQYWSLTEDELKIIETYLASYVPLIDQEVLNSDQLIEHMVKDKKNHKGKLMFSLLQSIGNSQENVALEPNQVQQSLTYMRSFI